MLSRSGDVAVRMGLMPRGNAGGARHARMPGLLAGLPVRTDPQRAMPCLAPRGAHGVRMRALRGQPPLACPYPEGITPAEGHLAAVCPPLCLLSVSLLAGLAVMADKLPSLLPLPGGYAIVSDPGLLIRGGRARNRPRPLPRL